MVLWFLSQTANALRRAADADRERQKGYPIILYNRANASVVVAAVVVAVAAVAVVSLHRGRTLLSYNEPNNESH
jgi:hypothetical protein